VIKSRLPDLIKVGEEEKYIKAQLLLPVSLFICGDFRNCGLGCQEVCADGGFDHQRDHAFHLLRAAQKQYL